VPLVYPVAVLFGIDPVHFGVITCTNLAIGMYTPPFGANIFLSAGIGKLKADSVFKAAVPLIIIGVIGCLLITFVPGLSSLLL
jgi:C4-dicarboxylate transporter DctM subunit